MAPPGSVRVIAGSVGGLRIATPAGDDTRPTADRVRQATFNALESMGAVEGARVLDAYAGSGALGIEALSRGAGHVTFADPSAAAREAIVANLAVTGFAAQATVLPANALHVAAGGPWDLVLLDPPYTFDRWDDLLAVVAAALAPDASVAIESDREVAVPPGLEVRRVRRYGGTVVSLVSPTEVP